MGVELWPHVHSRGPCRTVRDRPGKDLSRYEMLLKNQLCRVYSVCKMSETDVVCGPFVIVFVLFWFGLLNICKAITEKN